MTPPMPIEARSRATVENTPRSEVAKRSVPTQPAMRWFWVMTSHTG